MTDDQTDELERLCKIGLEMVRDARPKKPIGKRPDSWVWRSETRNCDWPMGQAPFGIEHGDDVEAMLHGGTTIRGNLKAAIHWSAVTAIRWHGRQVLPGDLGGIAYQRPRDGWPA